MTLAGSPDTATDTGLAAELGALYARAKAAVGAEDLAHIRNVTAYGEAIDARRRELLRDGGPRAIRRATALEMAYRLMQFSELGHNIIHGSYDHLPDCGEYHSDCYHWDFNVDVDHWKTMHHVGHHPNTNIVGRDHDLGYSLFRGSAGQDWYGHHIGQVALISVLAAMAPLAAPFFLSNIARKVEGHRFFSSYTLRSPARIAGADMRRRFVDEPFRQGWKPLPTIAANYLGGVTGYMSVLFLVFIEHHAGELELFTDPGPDETADQYYERQIRATRNFLPSTQMDDALTRLLEEEVPFENRPDLRIFYGGLDTHIEHHLFPDLPPSMQREIAPEVREIALRHGLPYHETPLLETVPLIAKTLTGLSVPFGERELSRPGDLLRDPAGLARRIVAGLRYRKLPESPYLDKPQFHNVPARVISATPVADGQALSVRLARPRGWEDVRWDAGAYVSVRIEVDDDDGRTELVRQYSLVRDSAGRSEPTDLEFLRQESGRRPRLQPAGRHPEAGAYVARGRAAVDRRLRWPDPSPATSSPGPHPGTSPAAWASRRSSRCCAASPVTPAGPTRPCSISTATSARSSSSPNSAPWPATPGSRCTCSPTPRPTATTCAPAGSARICWPSWCRT